MLREMDSPAARPAPRVAPVAAPAPAVHGKVNTFTPAAAPPALEAVAPAPPKPSTAYAPSAATQVPARGDIAPRERTALESHPESFDLELGRLPALDDASFASDHARNQGPNEFITDPMRRPLVADVPAPGAAPPVPAPSLAAPPLAVPALAGSEEGSVVVPVVLTREQIRAGGPIRLLLDIRVKEE